MSDASWYYEDGGQQAGPVSREALEQRVRAGGLAPRARVWTAGMADWQSWETLPELAALAPASGPPPLNPAASPSFPPPPTLSGNSYAADVLTGPAALKLYPKAPLGSRFVAALLDNLISSVPATVLLLAAIASSQGGGTILTLLLGLLAAAAFVWAIWYTFTKDGRSGGQSIGKKAMGLMVVHLATNKPCDNGQSALRALVLFGTNLVPYVGWLVEPVVTLAAAGGRRLGDSAAGTQVIAASEYRPAGLGAAVR